VQTFTFPSGDTVELPDGVPLCQQPASPDTHCLAYNRAVAIYKTRREVAEREQYLRDAQAAGRGTSRLEKNRDYYASLLDLYLTRSVGDQTPCVCAG
jgi:hypothetical protein